MLQWHCRPCTVLNLRQHSHASVTLQTLYSVEPMSTQPCFSDTADPVQCWTCVNTAVLQWHCRPCTVLNLRQHSRASVALQTLYSVEPTSTQPCFSDTADPVQCWTYVNTAMLQWQCRPCTVLNLRQHSHASVILQTLYSRQHSHASVTLHTLYSVEPASTQPCFSDSADPVLNLSQHSHASVWRTQMYNCHVSHYIHYTQLTLHAHKECMSINHTATLMTCYFYWIMYL